MCGICGEIRFDDQAADLGVLQKMSQTLRPRGPDDGGYFAVANGGMAHRRLRIMDLSDRSQQPMVDSQLGLTLVFNGAIYNHAQLRAELRNEGYQFNSDGDTEVVLKAYHAWGVRALDRFDGMFALAIWVRDSGRLFLARDRLGIKPLYYSSNNNRFRFASTLPALLAAGEIDTGIDPVALNFYLNFHAVVPPPHTILKGVRKLEPGHYMIVDADGTVRSQCYWSLAFEPRSELNEHEWQHALLDELRAAVNRRLVAAVDVGVLLSGGVDSSLLVALMAEQADARFQTYSIGFESVDDEPGDEFHYSDIVAQHFETRHHKMMIPSDELLAHLPDAIKAMSEPMVSHDCIGFYLLSREVAKSCKAVQSGQGADEVFAGYHWYPPMQSAKDPLAAYQQAFFDRDYAEYQATVADNLVAEDCAGNFVRQRFAGAYACDPVDKALHLDTTVMLVDDPVKRVDNMTMAWGLEARVPFLDHKLVEFAATMPAELKVRNGGKHVLKEAARMLLPAEVIDRPKGYFPVPALKYLRGEVLESVRDSLLGVSARNRGLFKSAYVDQLLANPDGHITPLRGSKLWQLGLLENWLQAQGV